MATDEDTKKRIRSLGYVGTALVKIADENRGITDYLIAQEELKKFNEGIRKLQLEPELQKGMDDLITYLGKKIQKRITQYSQY